MQHFTTRLLSDAVLVWPFRANLCQIDIQNKLLAELLFWKRKILTVHVDFCKITEPE